MKEEVFSRLAFGIIERIGKECIQVAPAISWKPKWQSEVESAYKHWRNAARSKLNCKKKSNGKDKLIDRHKIAAALALAILEKPPLSAPKHLSHTQYTVIEYYPNEFMAFRTAIQVVTQFAVADAKKNKDTKKLAYLAEDFTYPEANEDHYIEHACKALFHAREESTLDLLLLANLLFVLESYNSHFKTCPCPKDYLETTASEVT